VAPNRDQAAGLGATGRDAPSDWDAMAVVGRVARTHGIRGQVVVNLETDFPESRFRAGAELFARRAGVVERLTLTSVRFQAGRPIVRWSGVDDVNAALPYVGQELRVPRDWLPRLPAGLYYRHDLVGCQVVTTGDVVVGVVREVDGPGSGSRLVVETPRGDVLVPLAEEICPRIDVEARTIVIDPPDGLLDLNAGGR
jgi:16S rRNA processing protein RimM